MNIKEAPVPKPVGKGAKRSLEQVTAAPAPLPAVPAASAPAGATQAPAEAAAKEPATAAAAEGALAPAAAPVETEDGQEQQPTVQYPASALTEPTQPPSSGQEAPQIPGSTSVQESNAPGVSVHDALQVVSA